MKKAVRIATDILITLIAVLMVSAFVVLSSVAFIIVRIIFEILL